MGASLRRENEIAKKRVYAKMPGPCPEQFVLAGTQALAIQPEKSPRPKENAMMRHTLALICFAVPFCLARAGQPDDVKASIAYVQKLQTNTGGFLSMEPKPNIRIAPTLRATSAGVRALKYLGGKVPDVEACKKFVESCYDAAAGGFSDFPRGKPDVFATAVGIMAVAELKMPADQYDDGAIKYLSQNVKGFEDIRIAVAGLERISKKSPK